MVEIETLNIREGGVGKSRTFCDIEMVVVNDDGSFTQDLVNCRGTVEEGRNTGLDFVITPTSEQGQITSNEKVLILSTVGLNVFTLTFTRPDGSTFSRERICGLSGTGLEVEDDDDDDDDDDDEDDARRMLMVCLGMGEAPPRYLSHRYHRHRRHRPCRRHRHDHA